MELYKEYINEVMNGREIIYNDKGFLSYNIKSDCIYLSDFYVKPEYRKSHVGKELLSQVEKIAEEKNLNYLYGRAYLDVVNLPNFVEVWKKFGYTPESVTKDYINFIKRIK